MVHGCRSKKCINSDFVFGVAGTINAVPIYRPLIGIPVEVEPLFVSYQTQI